ncbi:MAG: iron-containing alcohol dehydrogenase [Deltaproteobacteria bacterium]|nr:iron-containing alcohol dehydrogenase [Deltaproteobacteria bacterium]
MSRSETADVPTSLADLLGFSTDCSCGRTHAIDTRFAAIRRGAIEEVVPFVRDIGRELSLVIVEDRVTRQIAGDRVVELLESDGHRVARCEVPDGAGGRPHADENRLELVEAALEGTDAAVSVGAGTINDLTKLASFNRSLPYVTVATAPSMNGYTSAIAAIMRAGVKRTVECHQPYAVVADLEILCRAPLELVAAGLGDLESKPTSTADYRLGGFLRDEYYCSAPEAVVFEAERRAAESAAGLKDGDPEAIAALSEALILSGLSMKLAGSSSPASGGEHLISHHWDMTANDENRVEFWHGSQVGVATIVTATLYERLAAIDPVTIDVGRLVAEQPTRSDIQRTINERHGDRANEVATEFFSKHLEDDALRTELERVPHSSASHPIICATASSPHARSAVGSPCSTWLPSSTCSNHSVTTCSTPPAVSAEPLKGATTPDRVDRLERDARLW